MEKHLAMGHISNESFKCNGSIPNSVGGGGSKPPNDTSHWSTMERAPTGFGGGGSKPPNDTQIIVAQRKRVGLITRRTVDRNNPMIIRSKIEQPFFHHKNEILKFLYNFII